MVLVIASGAGRFVEPPASALYFPHSIPTDKSPHVVMTPHHVILYTLTDEKNECNYVEIHPQGKRMKRRMSETQASTEDHGEPGLCEIRIKGHLDARWADWFGGMTITREDSGDTLLTGPVVDQAALHGLLKKVRDLGMPLISVNRVEL